MAEIKIGETFRADGRVFIVKKEISTPVVNVRFMGICSVRNIPAHPMNVLMVKRYITRR